MEKFISLKCFLANKKFEFRNPKGVLTRIVMLMMMTMMLTMTTLITRKELVRMVMIAAYDKADEDDDDADADADGDDDDDDDRDDENGE